MLDDHINKKEILYSQDALLTENLVSNKIFSSIANKTSKAIAKYDTANLLLDHIRVSEKNFPHIKKNVNEFATKMALKPPITYIMQSDQINAFTYGVKNNAWVVITTRLIDTFN
jgi:Zn-dependent protease with chaperone function